MAKAAKAAGLSYMAVTDHTKALAFIHGLNDAGVMKQIKSIASLNKKLRGFRVLGGTECDILRDGALDLKDATLSKLDWVGISVHSLFNLPRKTQTARVVKAMSNPNVDCLFHPTCRIIGKREGLDLDMDEVIAAAKTHRVALEIDCYPDRSDLRDLHVRAAVKAGVKLVVDTDAHDPEHFRFIPLGEAIARRGWATKNDVLNTKTAKDLLAYLDKKRKRR
jgi:DNA polymerase (family 10)